MVDAGTGEFLETRIFFIICRIPIKLLLVTITMGKRKVRISITRQGPTSSSTNEELRVDGKSGPNPSLGPLHNIYLLLPLLRWEKTSKSKTVQSNRFDPLNSDPLKETLLVFDGVSLILIIKYPSARNEMPFFPYIFAVVM